eukprot:10803537-Alexandrium_andersonii.AAC.1
MSASLVGSEMCIRDSPRPELRGHRIPPEEPILALEAPPRVARRLRGQGPVSYTHLTLPTICSV